MKKSKMNFTKYVNQSKNRNEKPRVGLTTDLAMSKRSSASEGQDMTSAGLSTHI